MSTLLGSELIFMSATFPETSVDRMIVYSDVLLNGIKLNYSHCTCFTIKYPLRSVGSLLCLFRMFFRRLYRNGILFYFSSLLVAKSCCGR